jgi:hypothetical protein
MLGGWAGPRTGPGHPGRGVRPTVRHDLPVLDLDNPLGQRGHAQVVGDHDDRSPMPHQIPKDSQDLGTRPAVKVPGGLVGQNDGGVIYQRPRDGHALLLAPGELAGAVVRSASELDGRQGFQRPLPPGLPGKSAVDHGQFHVAERSHAREQVERLKHETDATVPQEREGVVVERLYSHPFKDIPPGGGSIEAAQDAHQGGLPRARGAAEGHELTLRDLEAHPPHRLHAARARLIRSPDSLDGHHRPAPHPNRSQGWPFPRSVVTGRPHHSCPDLSSPDSSRKIRE